jgi:REP element-mobilizing transposase RayT
MYVTLLCYPSKRWGMGRSPRIIVPETIYHLVSRGNCKQRIFHSPEDFRKYLSLLENAKEKYLFSLYLYVFMPNHVHLILKTSSEEENSVSKIMHFLNGNYSKYFNRKYGRSGHLFQSRFYGEVIDDEKHFLELIRYVHLNPLRAGLVSELGDYKFSSYRCYTGLESDNNLVDKKEVLFLFGKNPQVQRERFKKFVEERKRLREINVQLRKR